jgi:hypothetical protein
MSAFIATTQPTERTIMATKTFKPVVTPTAKAARAATNNTDAQRVYAERVAQAQDEFLASNAVPSHTRQLVASVAQLLGFSVSIYWGVQLSGALMTAAVLYTGSAFIAFVLGMIAVVLSFKAAWNTGTFIARFVLDYDSDTLAEAGRELRIASARRVSIVKRWFTRDEPTANVAA